MDLTDKEIKELDYLDNILKNVPMTLNKRMIVESIKEKIQRLEAIDNANPSEALECLEDLRSNISIIYDSILNKIEQALIKAQEDEKEIDRVENQCLDILGDNIRLKNKAQEMEKVIEIIKELISKHCKIELIDGGTYYQIRIKVMGSSYTFGMSITKEEFDLLKRWSK